MRESTVERYLRRRVKEKGGEARKLTGRRNEPDRMVLWPSAVFGLPGRLDFVELKAPNGRVRAGQQREHTRLRKMGFRVFVLNDKAAVDTYVGLHV